MVKGRTDMGFKNPYVSRMNFEVNKDFMGDFDGDLDIRISMHTDKTDQQETKSFYLSSMTIELGEKNSDYPFIIEMEITADFFLESHSDIDENIFANHNTAAILYSYARPIISDMISKSGFPPFTLPFMNFTEMDLDYNEND